MSATNRGALRRERDFYPTPESAFKPLLEKVLPVNVRFYEPARGDGRLVEWLRVSGRDAYGSDLAQGFDFLKRKKSFQRDFIITNPPFSLAQEFVTHALTLSDDVMMLLPLGFLGSQKRRDWFVVNEPAALFVLSQRPSFTGDGKTDAADYAWFYWGNRWGGINHL